MSNVFAFDTKPFAPTTLDALIKNFKAMDTFPKSDKNLVFDASFPGHSSKVIYTGKIRRTEKNRLDFIKKFGASALNRENFQNMYKSEIQVSEDGALHWVGIQEETLDHLKKEIKPKSPITIFYRFAGATGPQNIIFLMMTFE